jgi:hypothetical protein
MVAEDYDGSIGVEFGVGAGGDFAHGHEEGVGDIGGLEFPGLAHVQKDWRGGLLAELGEGFDGDFRF